MKRRTLDASKLRRPIRRSRITDSVHGSIGYPMVSLGYGFKSYVGCRIKQYKQEDVSKENDFYHQLISYALPLELQKQTNDKVLPGRTSDDSLTLINRKAQPPVLTNGINTKTDVEALLAREASKRGLRLSDLKADIEDKQGALSLTDLELISNIPAKTISIDRKALANGDYENGGVRLAGSKTKTDSRRITFKTNQRVVNSEIIVDDDDNNESDSSESTASSGILKTSSNNSPKSARDSKAIEASLQARIRDENQARRRLESQTSQLESDMKRLRFELHSSRQQETELRAQLNTNYANERYLKSEISRLRTECDGFQQKITSLSNTSKQDKVSVTSLEKKLKIEREARNNLEQQKDPNFSQRDNHDTCVAKRQDLEQELVHMRGKMTDQEERIAELDAENEELKRKSQDNEGLKLKKETELLKEYHLENSLSSETRLKLDLFSALGDTRRQLEVVQGQLAVKEKDLEAFKAKIAEVMAVMPQNYSDGSLAGFVSHGNHVDASGGGLVKTSSYMPTTSSYLPTTSSYMPTTSSYNPVTKNGIL
eukprot:gene1467-1622_t